MEPQLIQWQTAKLHEQISYNSAQPHPTISHHIAQPSAERCCDLRCFIFFIKIDPLLLGYGLVPQNLSLCFLALLPPPASFAPCPCPRCLPAPLHLPSAAFCPPACPALLVLVLTVALFPPLKVRQPLSFAHSALKLWPAVPMDRTRKTFSISGTTHKYNNYTNSSLPSAISKLTKPTSAQCRDKPPLCLPQPHQLSSTLPHHSHPCIHYTRTSITKHPLYMEYITKYRAGNGQVNPNTTHLSP